MRSLLLVFVVGAFGFQADALFRSTANNIFTSLAGKVLPDSYSEPTCECGGSNSYTRIINGMKLNSMAGPYSSVIQVVNTTNERMRCTGFLITSMHAVTAAHCVLTMGTNPEKLGIVAGNPYYEYLTGKTTNYTQKVNISKIVRGNYTKGSVGRYNDIAILVLEKPVEFNQRVSPACLPKDSSTDLSGEPAKIAGWGFTKNDSTVLEDVIHVGRVTILDAKNCHRAWPSVPEANPKQLCVNSPTQRAATGDSGAPVLWYDETIGRHRAVGIISFGQPDLLKAYPRVNTKVSEYLDFIEFVVQNTSSVKTCRP